jgi:hypothetical protein
MPRPAPTNDFGLIATAGWDGTVSSPPLEDQMTRGGVPVDTYDLPGIIGAGGIGRLLFYISPNSGRPMTVLTVPHRAEVDQFAEDYFYFEMTRAEALDGDADVRWADLYDRCHGLTEA